MNYLNEFHKESTERSIAKQDRLHEQLMQLPLEARKQWAREEAQRAKERLAQAERMYPETK